jgi:uncharacterized protein (TIGR03085 family)
MTTLARRERASLCDTLLAIGPDAPTLCAGWAARDLAAHLVLREHRPIGALGIWLSPMKQRTEELQAQLADQRWETLVDQVRARPAFWHPARLGRHVEAVFDDGEFFIHHEDLRRGDGVARPRELSAEDEAALWHVLTGSGRLAFRRSPVGIVVDVPGHPRTELHKAGSRNVTLRGRVGEVLLATYGRGRAAEVDLDGAPEDITALGATSLGL